MTRPVIRAMASDMSELPSEIELQEPAAGKNASWNPEADSAEAKALKVPSGAE